MLFRRKETNKLTDGQTDKHQQLHNLQGGWREGRVNYVWMASHTTKSPHGGHLKNTAHLENSYRCKCIKDKMFTQDPSGEREKKRKEEQAFLNCSSEGGSQ